jgi:hypothetical protein
MEGKCLALKRGHYATAHRHLCDRDLSCRFV